MPYTPQTWTDQPSTTTPISAARLNYIESGLAAASVLAEGAATSAQLADNSTHDVDRANHTGTQTASTISDFGTSVGTSMVTNAGAFLDALNIPFTILIDPVTGVWPDRSTIPSGFTGAVLWDSDAYAGAAEPSTAVDNDLWNRRNAV